jgi:hypothetical protein
VAVAQISLGRDVILENPRLTGQSLLSAERNPNKCNWSTARKKIGPVNHPCDRLIDVISIASLFFLVDVTISRSTEEYLPLPGAFVRSRTKPPQGAKERWGTIGELENP